MEPMNEHTPSEQPRPAEQPPAPKKRFLIEKLEERIAPGQGNATKKGCSSIGIDYGSSSSVSY